MNVWVLAGLLIFQFVNGFFWGRRWEKDEQEIHQIEARIDELQRIQTIIGHTCFAGPILEDQCAICGKELSGQDVTE